MGDTEEDGVQDTAGFPMPTTTEEEEVTGVVQEAESPEERLLPATRSRSSVRLDSPKRDFLCLTSPNTKAERKNRRGK